MPVHGVNIVPLEKATQLMELTYPALKFRVTEMSGYGFIFLLLIWLYFYEVTLC